MTEPAKIAKTDKIIIAGGAGLVGQNLVLELENQGYSNLVVIDKNGPNLQILKRRHPALVACQWDLAEAGEWSAQFAGAASLLMLQAQITGKNPEPFVRNNIDSTHLVLEAVREHAVPYIVHISSSVVNSVADDEYTRTKAKQEDIVKQGGFRHCVLRPTLMFGWFDPKHLGWLARFMEKTPVFPIPGHGRYSRQPLYIRDFCKMIIRCMETQPDGEVFDVVGDQYIDYVDIIRTIKKVKKLRTLIIHLPFWFFSLLMRSYAVFSKYPPFTNDQLIALTAGDDFKGVDTEQVFGVKQMDFEAAMDETYNHPEHSKVILKRTGMAE
jgi:nucleoside-diphosphate-sugar epimerase